MKVRESGIPPADVQSDSQPGIEMILNWPSLLG
jgi:hypothetical protein